MQMINDRGKRPLKRCEGSCRRRIKKPTHQAGSPEFVSHCGCPIGESLQKEMRALAYSIRVGSLTSRQFSTAAALVRAAKQVTTPSLGKAQCARSHLPRRLAPSDVPLRRRKVAFVTAKQLGELMAPVPFTPAPRKQSVAVLAYRDVPYLGYDTRVAGTWLEAAAARVYRKAQAEVDAKVREPFFTPEEAVIMMEDRVMRNLTRGQHSDYLCYTRGAWCGLYPRVRHPEVRVDPFPKAKISDYELGRLLKQDPEAVALVEQVKKTAPPSLSDLLAGEDWGVIDFSKMGPAV